LLRRLLGVHDHKALFRKTLGNVILVHQRGIENDDEVGSRHGIVTANRYVVDSRVGAHRCAAALGAVLGKGLNALAGAHHRLRKQLRGGLRALAGSRVPANLDHRSSSSTAAATSLATRTASTTVAPPF